MYSQRGEDDFLLTIFGDTPGRFIDVGAFDGKTNSNVWWAIEKGWSGVMIEPAAAPFVGLLRNVAELSEEEQQRLTLVNCAIHPSTSGLLSFQHSPDQVSTMDIKHFETWREVGQYQPCYVHTVTMNQILNQFEGPFDLISIDAEGVSIDIAMGFPWGYEGLKPKVMVVEHNGERLVELGQFMQLRGYRQEWIRGENAIYVSAT
jgi:FkbM family methyltransferase